MQMHLLVRRNQYRLVGCGVQNGQDQKHDVSAQEMKNQILYPGGYFKQRELQFPILSARLIQCGPPGN
jgi:hypothetical protein